MYAALTYPAEQQQHPETIRKIEGAWVANKDIDKKKKS